MFETLKDRQTLARLFRERRKLDAAWDKSIREAHAAKQRTEHLRREHYGERDFLDDEIYQLQTRMLSVQAERLLMPLPDFEDETMWRDARYLGGRYLTTKGISELRSSIRKERRERWEFWAGRLAAGTGLIGTLIGLVSVLKR